MKKVIKDIKPTEYVEIIIENDKSDEYLFVNIIRNGLKV